MTIATHALPVPEGFTGSLVTDPFGRVPLRPIPHARRASALADLEAEYALFTLAPAYLKGPLPDASLIDVQLERNREIRFHLHRFDRALFHGLKDGRGRDHWNRCLWAVDRAAWPELEDFLKSLLLSDAPNKRLVGIGAQEVLVPDPCGPGLPAHRVTAFVVAATDGTWAFQPAKATLADHVPRPPVLTKLPPTEQMLTLARALAEGKNFNATPVPTRPRTREV